MSKDKEQLNPCKCGEKDIHNRWCECGCYTFKIECPSCGKQVWKKGKQKAIKAWNREQAKED